MNGRIERMREILNEIRPNLRNWGNINHDQANEIYRQAYLFIQSAIDLHNQEQAFDQNQTIRTDLQYLINNEFNVRNYQEFFGTNIDVNCLVIRINDRNQARTFIDFAETILEQLEHNA